MPCSSPAPEELDKAGALRMTPQLAGLLRAFADADTAYHAASDEAVANVKKGRRDSRTPRSYRIKQERAYDTQREASLALLAYLHQRDEARGRRRERRSAS